MYRTLSLIGLLWLLPALALGQMDWSLSGYASLGAGRLADDDMEFQDYTGSQWRFKGDTVLGLQLNLSLAERLSLTVQGVSRGFHWDDTESFEPELDWLFLGYQLNDHWRARLGRMRTPLYLYSETLDVGYSYVWVRPPIDVYAPPIVPFTSFDGVDLSYVSHWSDISIDLQLLAGVSKRDTTTHLDITVEPMLGGVIALHTDDLTLRYSMMQFDTHIEMSAFNDIAAAFDAASTLFDPRFAEVPRQFRTSRNLYHYHSAGLSWRPGNFTGTAEAFTLKNTDDGYTNDARGWYLSLQYRIDRLTPYVVYGWSRNQLGKRSLEALQKTYQGWPAGQSQPAIQSQVDQLDLFRDFAIQKLQKMNFEPYTWTLGVRYDIHPKVALKAEWKYYDLETGGHITVNTTDHPGYTSLTTFVLDVVF